MTLLQAMYEHIGPRGTNRVLGISLLISAFWIWGKVKIVIDWFAVRRLKADLRSRP